MSHFAKCAVFVGAALLRATSAYAVGLEGSTASVGVYTTFPGTLTLVTNTATATVGPSIEFPKGSLVTTALRNVIPLSIDVSATTIELNYPSAANATSTSFNGYHFDFSDLALPGITGVSVDPLSTLSPVSLSSTANSVFVNVEGLSIPAGSRIVLDVSTTAVPEPETSVLLLTGLGMIGVVARHRKTA